MYYYSTNYHYPSRQDATMMTSLGKVELEGYYDLLVYETWLSVIEPALKIQMSTRSIKGQLIGAKPDHAI